VCECVLRPFCVWLCLCVRGQPGQCWCFMFGRHCLLLPLLSLLPEHDRSCGPFQQVQEHLHALFLRHFIIV